MHGQGQGDKDSSGQSLLEKVKASKLRVELKATITFAPIRGYNVFFRSFPESGILKEFWRRTFPARYFLIPRFYFDRMILQRSASAYADRHAAKTTDALRYQANKEPLE